ncbi:MAG TPA: malto-oligosyltrehalose trehalohydrolase [Thermoanaerobaculia bacterium]|nr:malto-oligosyltrehalose trehalohydrolase [Thermoanaerobaculia bacterium]
MNRNGVGSGGPVDRERALQGGAGEAGRAGRVPRPPGEHPERELSLGALYDPEAGVTRFRVWAPRARRVELLISEPGERVLELEAEQGGPERSGYFRAAVEDAAPGTLYRYRLHLAEGGETIERADPASRHQPRGVHGPSEVVASDHPWQAEGWSGVPLADTVLYEIHVGTFSEEGTFEGVIPHLDALAELGVTTLELMPVAQFPGERNWGYDGVYPYAAQHSYGGPAGLRRLVDAAHRKGLAVILDVVYNHLGPEGNHLRDFGPYFTGHYATPWGDALNFDGRGSDGVRRFFVENALAWIAEHRLDGLRLDAVHAIVDNSERPFLQELATAVHALGDKLGRRVHLFAESANNTLRFLRSSEHGGCGMDAQWSDDFHHALHVALTGEDAGYYRDFGRDLGTLRQLARAYREGWVYRGQYSPFRGRRHGEPAAGVAARRFVVFSQNHDQTGNRMRGERLAALVDFERLKLAAGAVLLSPFTPLLFMGEEYGEVAPFQYFVHHGDADLVEAVRKGRAEEFGAFGWQGEVPDPQDEETFRRSRLDRSRAAQPPNAALRELYRELLRLRREVPALAERSREEVETEVGEDKGLLFLWRRHPAGDRLAVLNFSPEPHPVGQPEGRSWRVVLDSADPRWGGPGRPGAAEQASAGREPEGGAGPGPGEAGEHVAPWSFLLLEPR